MPTGTFGGFSFDTEIYRTFVDQEPTFTDNIIASGILASDQSLAEAFANGGAFATTRFYNPLDPASDAPLDNDGLTNNVPVTIAGGKQTYTRLAKMKAWKATQFVRELTSADPMAAVGRNVGRYWRMYAQDLLVKTAGAVLGVSALSSHTHTATAGVDAGLIIDGQQKALGDFSSKFGLIVMHSKIVAEYKKLGLLNFDKYVITNVIQREAVLPTLNGLIVVENDRGTFDGTNYHCYLFGQGSILQATPNTITPDYTRYEPETNGGVDILYTKRQFILHPNGVSFIPSNIAGEVPTEAEFTTTANWDLRYDAKNVRIGQIVIPAAQL